MAACVGRDSLLGLAALSGEAHQLYWALPTEWSMYGFTEMVCTPPAETLYQPWVALLTPLRPALG